MPTEIYFCGKRWKVILKPNLTTGNFGSTNWATAEIEIDSNFPEQEQKETLIHELIHIAFRNTAYSFKDRDEEEKIVASWSSNIFGILKDNNLLNL